MDTLPLKEREVLVTITELSLNQVDQFRVSSRAQTDTQGLFRAQGFEPVFGPQRTILAVEVCAVGGSEGCATVSADEIVRFEEDGNTNIDVLDVGTIRLGQ